MTDEARFEMRAVGRRIDARWLGAWNEALVGQYEEKLRELLERHPSVEHLVVDACGITDCDVLGRGRLADLQEWGKTRFRRSVFLADRPRVRGLCLWIVRIAKDDDALVTASRDEVDDWLAGEGGRLERAMQRLSAHLEKIGKASA